MAASSQYPPRPPKGGKRLIWFFLFMVPVFGLLLWLGFWQLHRLEWKQGLLAQIDTRVHAPPVPLDVALARAADGEDIEYLRVKLRGRYDNARERQIYAISEGGKPGWHVLTPFREEGGPVVLVDRGYVPNALKAPKSREKGEIEGETEVIGLVRKPRPKGYFTPENDPEADRWYWRDMTALTAAIYPAYAGSPPEIAPFFVDAEASDIPGGWPKGGQTDLALPNNHLQYALTWFSMAAALAVVFVIYGWSVLRGKPLDPDGEA
ncbi:SURF1 family protein [Methyloligella sp. 2.7D]|uniref:SURF1 family protein n=1 Tax=unclassified Methyloligella TaxID=2625955 RepID=UPI00157DF59C|nr:SURF1 family protein [Methyloligella sp. GL2]QKP78326.1 SURF1 family protein [Methyloligella sp. GL2]